MKRIAYFDCSSGISGDMILGALVDAGMPTKELEHTISCLPIKGYKLDIKSVKRAGFKATKVDVEIQGARDKRQGARKWKDIEKIIKTSTLPKDIKQKGLQVFKRLFEVEAKVHGKRLHNVHLHELGAVDCIIDIIGTLTGLKFFKIERLYSSPLNLGSGTIKTEHGILPIPTPATAELLKGIPVYSSDTNFVTSGNPGQELTTPTGAVLISSLAHGFGSMPDMQVSTVGIGAGSKDFKKQPNVLRIFIGHKSQNPPIRGKGGFSAKEGNGGFSEQNITVIETNIDDMNPQIYEYVMEKLFKAGALDVFLAQVIMKKGRPGIKLTVLCNENKREDLIKIILRETTSIGVRFYEAGRKTLRREVKTIETEFGKVNIKIAKLNDNLVKIIPEYGECKKIAKRLNLPLIEVIENLKNEASVKVKK